MELHGSARASRGAYRQTGLTWLEFSVVASVLAVLAGSLLTALLYYEELAEATVVQLTIQNIRSGLRYQIADRLVAGRTSEIGQLLGANPVSWLERPPDGYVGIVRTGSVRSLPAGSWFYDIDRGRDWLRAEAFVSPRRGVRGAGDTALADAGAAITDARRGRGADAGNSDARIDGFSSSIYAVWEMTL